ncbi:MAG: PfkB family carbohydrate kinase [Armatimonadota bacterium]
MPESVVIVGSLALDTIQTPFGQRENIVGGAGYYGSVAASLFAPVKLVGVIGDDFPQHALDTLEERQVDTEGVRVIEDGKSFRWAGRYEASMNVAETLDTQLNVFADFDPVLPDDYRSSRFVFLANIMPSLQLSVLDQIRGDAFSCCDTMNYWIENDRDDLVEVIRRVDMVLMNDAEARQFADTTSLVQAADALVDLGPRYVVIKMGEYGATMVSEDSRLTLPCCPLPDVHDPTGAGDSFAGGMMGYLAWANSSDEEDVRRGLVLGTVTASRAIQSFGTRALEETSPEEIYDGYRLLQQITHFEDLPETFEACPTISTAENL